MISTSSMPPTLAIKNPVVSAPVVEADGPPQQLQSPLITNKQPTTTSEPYEMQLKQSFTQRLSATTRNMPQTMGSRNTITHNTEEDELNAYNTRSPSKGAKIRSAQKTKTQPRSYRLHTLTASKTLQQQ